MKYLKLFNESSLEPDWKEIDEIEYNSKYYESVSFSDDNLKSLLDGLDRENIISKWDKMVDNDTWYSEIQHRHKKVTSIRLWTYELKDGVKRPNNFSFNTINGMYQSGQIESRNYGVITQLEDEWFLVEWYEYLPESGFFISPKPYICDQMDSLIDFLKSNYKKSLK
jgi:hypothetical protein